MTNAESLTALQQPVVRPLVHEHVAERLRQAIRTGTLAPDDRLPSEPDLAGALGVSRSTLREALQRLRGEGYVVSRRGAAGGLFVSDRAARHECTKEQLAKRREDLEQLLEYRAVVEPHAAYLAAERRSETDLAAIGSAVAAMSGCKDIPAFRQADMAFHRAVARAAGNAYIERAIGETREGLFGLIDLADFDVLVSRSVPEHEAILKAIGDRGRTARNGQCALTSARRATK